MIMGSTNATIVLLMALYVMVQFVDCDDSLLTKTVTIIPQDFSNCSAKGDTAKILNFSLNSYTFKRGDAIKGNVTYFLSREIDGNITLSATGTHGVVPYFSNTLNLCHTKLISCPLKVGQANVVFQYQLGQYQPCGWYDVHFVVSNEDKEKKRQEILCLDFKIEIHCPPVATLT